MEEKICKDCGKKKNISNFRNINSLKRNKIYISNFCTECYKKRKANWDKKYSLNNKEKIKIKRELNREWHKEYCKKWHELNKNKEKLYREKTKEHRKEKTKEWTKNNIEKVRKWHKENKRKVRKNELIYMKDRIRNMVSHSFKRKKYTKKSKTYEILGAEYNIVWEHLKKTWYKNYGTIYNGECYEIDHIIPLASANTEKEVIRLCHYTNLQLLTPEDNLIKGAK